jgi:hypothetical protein
MLDPFPGFYVNRFFSYRFDSDYVYCGGETGSSTITFDTGDYVVLMYPVYPGTIEGDAQGKVFTANTQSDVNMGDYTLTVQWDVTVRLLETRDLTVDRLEVTQGLQNKTNTIPLIQGRRTVVRAYLGVGRDQVPMPAVTGKLSGYVGSTLLGSVPAFNPGGRITAPVEPNWKQIEHTLNFELPYAWTLQPNLRLEVEVNPDHSVTETNYNNNKLSTPPLVLLPCNGISVAYQPIQYTPPGGYDPANPSANIAVGQEFMRKIYPIPDEGLLYYPIAGVGVSFNLNIPNRGPYLLDWLTDSFLSSSAPRAKYYYGWLPSLAVNGNGLGHINSIGAFGNDTEIPNRWRRTFAHELGHNYGFTHIPETTTAGAHWFDVYDRVIKPVPASVGGEDLLDFMVPGRLEPEAWISPVNYEYLVGKICSAGAAAAANTSIQSSATVDTLLVSGIINNTTPATGSLDPLYHFTTVPTYTLPDGAQYCVNLKDAANTMLSQYCFNQDFSGDSGTPVDAASFGMVVPYPTGLNRVDLVKAGSILATQIASSNPPSVTVTSPNAAGLTLSGAQDVTWTGTDADGGTLTYNILYSRDNGATWEGIASGITDSAYSLDFSGLPGTTGASGMIKVMVSDGFNSAEDSSDNPFTIGNKPPEAVIISPSSGAEFTTGPQVVLEGAGMDLEDRSLADSALSWVSNIDGALGAGQLLEVTLSPGVHTITLTVTDSGGLANSASIQITVMEPTLIVVSSLRADPDPTNAGSVDFTVTFSKPVTGVDVTDFTLTKTGAVTGESVNGVSGGPTIYTVSVGTGTGDGTIRLDVEDDDTIQDASGNPLGGIGAGNGDFTAGEEYTVSKKPAPTDITLSSTSVAEFQPDGTLVGTFTTVDAIPPSPPFTYTLVTGAGDLDNESFTISGDQLLTAEMFFTFIKNSYNIRVRTTTSGGKFFEKAFTITVTSNNYIPVLLAPPDGDNLLTNRPGFDWDDVSGATGYTLQISRNSAFTLLVGTYLVTSSTYMPAVDLPANTTLYWRVRTKWSGGYGDWSPMRSLNTANPPSVPLLLLPAVNALAINYKPRLDWSNSTLPAGIVFQKYEVQLATDSTFTTPSSVDVPGLATNSEHMLTTDLTPNTIYYWHVRSYNTLGQYSSWSLVRTFRTALLPPTLNAPDNATTQLTRRPAFDWSDVTGATGYTLQVSKNTAFTSLVGTYNTIASNYTPVADLPPSVTLYWRVQSKGANGPSLWSGWRSFTTPNPPGIPLLAAPANNALTTDYTPFLDWSNVTVPTTPPGSPAFDHYRVQVDDNADFSSPVIDENVPGLVTNSSYTPGTPLASNTKFYWRVSSYNISGQYSTWSLVRYFRTAILPPILSAPADTITVPSLRPTFDWGNVAGANGYTIQASKNNTFTPLVLNATITGGTNSQFTPLVNLPVNTMLYWRVKANGLNGPSLWSSPVWSFTTPNPPGVPLLTAPALNSLQTDYSPTLKWSRPIIPVGTFFEHYQVQIATDLAFTTIVQDADATDYNTPEYTASPDLNPNTKYYWRARAWNSLGHYSIWLAVRTFRTAAFHPDRWRDHNAPSPALRLG